MNSFASAFGLIDNGESLKTSFDHFTSYAVSD
jgi:hypothetical protein